MTTYDQRRYYGQPVYSQWKNIRDQLRNPGNSMYRFLKDLPCDWQKFREFRDYVLSELGPQPTPEHILSRRDLTLGFVEGNLEWTTRRDRQRRQRHAHIIELPSGETLCAQEYCLIHNIRYAQFCRSLRQGLSVAEAHQRHQRTEV